MEYRSERMKRAKGVEEPGKVVGSNFCKVKPENDSRYYKIYRETERKEKSRLWDFLRQLCSVFCSWVVLVLIEPLVSCLLSSIGGITCHHHHHDEKNKPEQSLQQHKYEVSPRTEGPHSQNRPLFSSDDEEEDSYEDGSDHQNAAVEFVIDDYELPFVQKIDTVLHFCNLLDKNYPAFKNEVSKYICSSEYCADQAERLKAERSKKRPLIFQRVVRILKKRELRNRMTKVQGDGHKQWLLNIALVSRFAIFLLQVLTVNFGEILKHENDGFKFTAEENYGKLLDPLVNSTLGGYINWDAHYFLHIAVYGYTSENILAFFPLFPMILYLPSRFAYHCFGSLISLSSLAIIFGVLFNTWLFVKCTENIYDLAVVWSNKTKAFVTTACLFFAFNPASIFFSGLYTETLFAYFTSKTLLSLFQGKYWTAILSASLSSLCRANGILNVGFIIAFSLEKQLNNQRRPFRIPVFVLSSALSTVIIVIPFLLFQIYGILMFCKENALYDSDPSQVPLYCVRESGRIPTLPYSYIQNKYWNVGFLRYFQLKQIPNFLLAFPVLYVLGSESFIVFQRSVTQMMTGRTLRGVYFALQALHGLFLTLFCFFFVHVQVSTRMIMAACPYLFIYMADSYHLDVESFKKGDKIDVPKRSFGLMFWCATYFILGTIAFSSGLPWT